MKKIANVINFARSVEPRTDDDGYLLPTLEKELALCREHGFRSTVLLQYDALIRPDYQTLVKRYEEAEPGLWLEVVKPLAEEAEVPFGGRYVWDWTNGVNYLSQYTEEERRRLLDAAFAGFYRAFGYYPKTVGAWTLDSVSLAYMAERFGLDAACICRDQYGTDYTTLWGGVYNGGYYPCKNNLLCPAATGGEQINVPVFRMLGPDPIYQYDMGLGEPERPQGVCTLEPVYAEGGGCETWVRWYLKENYNDKCLSHAYAQFGQENSFGWEEIKQGLPMQLRLLEEAVKQGEIELMTLAESGRWYREQYQTTAPVAMCTDSSWKGDGTKSVWYASRYYRANLLQRDGAVWFRDIQLFDEAYRSGTAAGTGAMKETGFFNLPLIDGFRFSKDGVRAGLFLKKDGDILPTETLVSAAVGETQILAKAGAFGARFTEDAICLTLPEGSVLAFVAADVPWLPYREAEEKTLRLSFSAFGSEEYDYAVSLRDGCFRQKNGAITVVPENGRITLEMKRKRTL